MLDDLTQLADHFFATQRLSAEAFTHWIIALIERIPEPARKYLPLKSERPESYEIVEPGQFD